MNEATRVSELVKIDSRGRVVIPRAFREGLGLADGKTIKWVMLGDGKVELLPIAKDTND